MHCSTALAEIMDANPVPCFVIDAQHRVIHWNKGCEQILGIAAADIIGTSNQWQPFYDAPRPTLADLIIDHKLNSDGNADRLYRNKTLRRSASIPDAFEAEDLFPCLQSGSRHLFFTAAPIRNRDGEIIGAVETLQDVTLQRQAEAALRQSNDQLEHMVATRTAELAESNRQLAQSLKKAEEANRIKTAFLATVSHELKTPLHGIIGVAELIRMDLVSQGTSDYARIIQSNGESLLQLIDSMLSLTELEAGEKGISIAEHSTQELLESVASEYAAQAKQKGIRFNLNFSPSMPEIVSTDGHLLSQIIAALINNAVKFTDRGQVDVDVTAGHEALIISVTDTGPGIPPEQQSVIFEKFRQLENFESRQHDGLGLGLALAKARSQLLGGSLRLETTQADAGATFVLAVPNKPR